MIVTVLTEITDTRLVYYDLDHIPSPGRGMPQLHADLYKNTTIPNVNGGILWEDSINKRLNLFGGEHYDSPPAAFVL